jgi:putative DNA primase/helicase
VAQFHGAPFRDWLRYITDALPEVTRAKALLKEYAKINPGRCRESG